MEDNFNTGDAAYTGNASPIIDSKQVSAILEIDIRTAQNLLRKTRKALGKPKNAYVNVKEFCAKNHLPEDEAMMALQSISSDPDSK